jgi:GNAT superfamily N-acetyltransferase
MNNITFCSLDARPADLSLDNPKWWGYAVQDGRVIGAMSLVYYENWLWLNDLFIEPASRRQGVATKLIRWSIDQARGIWHCADGVACGITQDNEPSERLFESVGFSHTPDHPVFGVNPGARLYSRKGLQ